MTKKQTLGENDKAVLALLSARQVPMAAYDILQALSGTPIRAASQVYRALEKLLERDLVHRVESLNAFVACNHATHTSSPGFFVCKSCKSVTEFDPVDEVSLLTDRASGFKIERYSVELTGTCVVCQGQSGAPS